MAFGVFIHRADSIYEDSPAERYQFPRQYLGRVRPCIDDWIVYYEPRKIAESRGYFAIAKVQGVIPDPVHSDMYIALIEPGSYLDFVHAVPFRDADGVTETGVLNASGGISGRAQSAVRPLSADDFDRIIHRGLSEQLPVLERDERRDNLSGFQEAYTSFDFDQIRERVSILSSRVIRDRVFRRVVLRAYDERCAVSGLKLINGGGRAEVDAAHIRPVQANGPDVVTNGIALCGTAHWMFDRGLIGLTDKLEILISRQINDLDGVRSFINRDGRASVPQRAADRPHPHFLQWHRDHCFKS